MERQTQCTRRTLRQVRTRLPTFQITWVLLAICGSLAAVEGHKCDSDIITLDHTRALKELIDNQALDACHVPFSFMTLPDRDADYRHKVCYLLAATSSVKAILESQKKNYKNTSSNYNNAEKLDLLLKTLREEKCIQRQHAENCYRTFSGSPADMLTMVEHFFNLTKEVLPIDASSYNCAALYATCEEPAKDNPPQNEAYTTPGPDQCKCSCPTPGSTSSALTSIKAIAASPEAIGSGRNQNGDEEESDRRVHIYVMVPCVLGILVSLCALLYYRRQNQSLRRELQQAVSRSERQEEGPLQRLQRDEVEVEMDEV